jgi:hypothetical protein
VLVPLMCSPKSIQRRDAAVRIASGSGLFVNCHSIRTVVGFEGVEQSRSLLDVRRRLRRDETEGHGSSESRASRVLVCVRAQQGW